MTEFAFGVSCMVSSGGDPCIQPGPDDGVEDIWSDNLLDVVVVVECMCNVDSSGVVVKVPVRFVDKQVKEVNVVCWFE